MNSAYGPAGALDMLRAVLLHLHRTCAAEFRTAHGSPDLARLVPEPAGPVDVLTAAADRAHAAGRTPDARDIAAIESPFVATASLRPILQAALDAIDGDRDGTAGPAAVKDRLTPLSHRRVVTAFPLLAVAIRVASPSADPGDDLQGSS